MPPSVVPLSRQALQSPRDMCDGGGAWLHSREAPPRHSPQQLQPGSSIPCPSQPWHWAHVPSIWSRAQQGQGCRGCLPHTLLCSRGEGRQGKSMGRGGPDHGEDQNQQCRLLRRSRAPWQLTAPPTLHPYEHRCPLAAQQSRTPPRTQHQWSSHLTASSQQKKPEMSQEPTNTAVTEPQVP